MCLMDGSRNTKKVAKTIERGSTSGGDACHGLRMRECGTRLHKSTPNAALAAPAMVKNFNTTLTHMEASKVTRDWLKVGQL